MGYKDRWTCSYQHLVFTVQETLDYAHMVVLTKFGIYDFLSLTVCGHILQLKL